MGANPINLAVRFILEIAALAAIGQWAWQLAEKTWLRVLFTIAAVVLSAAVWGTFAVPNDPSRSGHAPIPTLGWVRLLLELAFFFFAVWSFFATGGKIWGTVLAVVTLVHYLVSYDRVIWLLKQ